jgi:hypothetical protein
MTSQKHGEPHDPQKIPRVEVYWTTVTYKTVAVYISLAFAILLLVLYLIAPDRFMTIVRQISDKVSGGDTSAEAPPSTQARFVNLDGKVQIKKVNSVQWVNADYRTTLDKGDLIQTGGDGNARLTFPDGTTYTVKPDTLITVEENQMTQSRRTDVAVRISSGAVDLATGAYEPGSRSEVLFEDARASLQPRTRAAVRSDPENKQHEITVTQGGANLDRGGQQISISQFERVSFPTGGPVQRSQVVAPPQLKNPVNLQAIVVTDPQRVPVRLEWEAVQGAVSYLVRVSRTSAFTQNVREQRTSTNGAEITGLGAGDYFWAVTATDTQKRTSEPSEVFKFTLAVQGRTDEMLLEIEHTQVYGNQVEIVGRTEPGAALLCNGQTVTNINADGRFRYMTPPLAKGSQKIIISGQNRRGGYNKVEKTIVIQ